MPAATLKKFLDENNVRYLVVRHSVAYTSQELAARMHIHGWELAKTVLFKADGRLIMAVLPAPMMVDVEKLRDVAGAKSLVLASEEEFRGRFPDCDLGAMPPFGRLFDIPTYAEKRLSRDPSIVFPAGSHTEAIRMDTADFERLARPKIASFGNLEPARL